jgi:electron transfer flavoprotein alpha subunit
MLSEIWSFIETENDQLSALAGKMATESYRAAEILKGEACVVICSEYSSKVVEELTSYGLEKIYFITTDLPSTPDSLAMTLNLAVKKYGPEFLLFPATSHESEIAAKTAGSLQRGLISNCIDFEVTKGNPVARKVVFNGKAHALCSWKSSQPYLATIDPSALEDVKKIKKTDPEVICSEFSPQPSRVKLLKKWEITLSDLDLNEARIVIGVGGGVDPPFMDTIERLADMLKAVVGGSRIAVYSGLIPLDKQIGTTGKWLDSDTYITIGISGAPQHVMGIKKVKKLIAVDIAKQAPIFKYAKLGIVGDMHDVIPILIRLIENNSEKTP